MKALDARDTTRPPWPWDEIVRELWPRLRSLALRRYGLSAEDAGDVLQLVALDARVNLAELDLFEGSSEKALRGFSRALEAARRAGLPQRITLTMLYTAECLMAIGQRDAAAELMSGLSGDVGIRGAEAAIAELQAFVNNGDVSALLISHVRAHLNRLFGGEDVPYRSFRSA